MPGPRVGSRLCVLQGAHTSVETLPWRLRAQGPRVGIPSYAVEVARLVSREPLVGVEGARPTCGDTTLCG